jgi:hypothetical protein
VKKGFHLGVAVDHAENVPSCFKDLVAAVALKGHGEAEIGLAPVLLAARVKDGRLVLAVHGGDVKIGVGRVSLPIPIGGEGGLQNEERA